MAKKIVIALSGNPNSGKTTIFNNLTGARQKVGNWGGVTVEKKEGTVRFGDYEIKVVDLPGTYSLTAYTMEEVIARDFIIHEKPDVVVNIIDASNLERNLYLATQLLELKVKLIFVLNMYDVAKARGISIDIDTMSMLLGVPIIPTIGTKKEGMDELLETVIKVAEDKDSRVRQIDINYGQEVEEEIQKLERLIEKEASLKERYNPRWLAIKLLENDQDVLSKIRGIEIDKDILNQAKRSREHLWSIYHDDPETIIADRRYGFIGGTLKETVTLASLDRVTLSDKIDKVLTNRLLSFPIFIFFMWLMFQITFRIGAYPMEWIDTGVGYLASFMKTYLPPGPFSDLIVDGIISGVGGVIIFLPNILLLFLCISFMEDTGYLARAAFIMDKVMHTLGLHGKSFIPLLMGFGCNVPAIMATRTLENRRDRLLTMLINPLMSCSARLPVYILLAGTFFPRQAGNVIFSIYILGVALALMMGQIFKRTLFKGESAPFVMELPPYRIPTLRSTLLHMWEKGSIYLKKMGGVILIASVIIWFLGAYPKPSSYSVDYKKAISDITEEYNMALAKLKEKNASSDELEKLKTSMEEKKGKLIQAMKAEELEYSFIGRMGRLVAPILKPIGFDWKMGVSLITGFVAKEVVVSTMAVLYQAEEKKENNRQDSLGEALKKSGLTPLTAYAFMAFVLIYVPCLMTVFAIRKESGSWGWMFFSIAYSSSLAWFIAFVIVKGGKLLGL